MKYLHCAFGSLVLLALGCTVVCAADENELLNTEQNERARELTIKGSASGPQREMVLRELGELLRPHREKDEDAKTLAALLELSADRESFSNDPLVATLEKMKTAGAKSVTPEEWAKLKREIEIRIDHVLKGIDSGKLDLEAAERLLAVAKYAADAWVELGKRLPGDAAGDTANSLFRILNRLHGIVSTVKGLKDPSANDLLEGIRDTLAEYRSRIGGKKIPSHLDAIEMPAAVSGAIIDHNRKALNEISGVLKNLPKAMQGDQEALEQMLKDTKKVEDTISREAYGRAMWNALTDRIIDRIPFARSVVTWFGTDVDLTRLEGHKGKGVVWSTSWGQIVIGDGAVRPAKGSFIERWDGTIRAGYVSGKRLVGSYELTHPAVAQKGVFQWDFTDQGRKPGGPPVHFEGFRFQEDPPEGTPAPWNGSR